MKGHPSYHGAPQSSVLSNRGQRNVHLDLVKGLLVLTMIVYHTFANFYDNYQPVLLIAQYVSGGFIYISGFLVGFYYLRTYNDNANIRRRLLIRFTKIFLIFAIANVGVFAAAEGSIDVLFNYLLLGTGKMRFEILLQISYVLFLASALSGQISRYPRLANISVLALLLSINAGVVHPPPNLYSVTIGLAGLTNSLLVKNIDTPASMGIACLVIAIAIAYSRVYFSWARGILPYVLYIIAVLVTFYNAARAIDLRSLLGRWMLLMGKYTLFSYIFQVFIIVTAANALGWKIGFLENWGGVIVVTAVLIGSVSIVDSLRRRVHAIDWSYRLVFS